MLNFRSAQNEGVAMNDVRETPLQQYTAGSAAAAAGVKKLKFIFFFFFFFRLSVFCSFHRGTLVLLLLFWTCGQEPTNNDKRGGNNPV